jgi:transcriptional regulator with XRE-family HTH domain
MTLMDNQAIRLENFRALRKKYGSKDVQDRLGWSKQQLSQYTGASSNPRPITDAVARRVERVYGLPAAWMDYPHYETEVLLQKFVSFIRSQPIERQKTLLQLVELAIKVGAAPPDKPD